MARVMSVCVTDPSPDFQRGPSVSQSQFAFAAVMASELAAGVPLYRQAMAEF